MISADYVYIDEPEIFPIVRKVKNPEQPTARSLNQEPPNLLLLIDKKNARITTITFYVALRCHLRGEIFEILRG